MFHEPGHSVGALQHPGHLELVGSDRCRVQQVCPELGERAGVDLVGDDLGELLQLPVACVLFRLLPENVVHLKRYGRFGRP